MPHLSRRHVLSCTALALAVLAAGCGSEPIAGPQRSPTLAASMSLSGSSLGARHVFLMREGVPADFAERVQAKGGRVLSKRAEAGLIITSGLSDVDANALGATGQVARDVLTTWVPTHAQLDASVASVSVAAGVAPTLRSPFAAAFLDQQWNMWQINAPKAWARITGSPTVRVAILDTGLDPDHPELAGLIDLDASAAAVPSTAGPEFPDWTDDETHGSFIGGLVTSNNLGIAGVAPNVRLIAIKVLDATGSGNFGDIIDGMLYAALNAHAQVINMSLGATLPADDPNVQILASILTQVVNFVTARGVVVVSAAGNEGVDLGTPHGFISLPCEAGTQLCVSATTFNDKLASYSNFGLHAIDVAAPGGDSKVNKQTVAKKWVLSLCSTHAAFCHSGTTVFHYAYAIGTSGAAPHVAGLAALIESQSGGAMSALDVMWRIRQTADDIGRGPLGDSRFGNGRINVARAVGVRSSPD